MTSPAPPHRDGPDPEPGTSAWRLRSPWERVTLAVPYAWLAFFFLAPFAIVFKISVADPIVAQPPFTPLFDVGAEGATSLHLTLDNYAFVLADRLYLLTYLGSLKLALLTTFLCLLLGFPMAYGIARSEPTTRRVLLMLVIMPFWISFLLRVYAWMGILGRHGVLNELLLWTGVISQPLELLHTDAAVFLGMVYSYLPFMILPLYATLERLDESLLEAASDLGGRPAEVFRDVTLPLALPGTIAGCLLVFIPAMGEFVIPALLGGADTLMIGRVVYEEFFFNRDWPVAATVAVLLLLLLVGPIVLLQRYQEEDAT